MDLKKCLLIAAGAGAVLGSYIRRRQVRRTMVACMTANVGSCFESETSCQSWLNAASQRLKESGARFIAIHFQEMGGKAYKTSDLSSTIPSFAAGLSERMGNAYCCSPVIYDAVDSKLGFTALGVMFIVHNSLVSDVQVWSFDHKRYINPLSVGTFSSDGSSVDSALTGRASSTCYIRTKHWGDGRKGFMQTRWKIGDWAFNLVNIHGTCDDGNVVAMQSSPSCFAQERMRGMQSHVKDAKVAALEAAGVGSFLFGDFNIRTDLHKLTAAATFAKYGTPEEKEEKKSFFEIQKKKFHVTSNTAKEQLFFSRELLKYDTETAALLGAEGEKSLGVSGGLNELPITFPPTYRYAEDAGHHRDYSEKRCPSYCDRVFMTGTAYRIVQQGSGSYSTVGQDSYMGDHKPVMLLFEAQY